MKTLIILILILLCLLTTPLSLKRVYDNRRALEKKKQEEVSAAGTGAEITGNPEEGAGTAGESESASEIDKTKDF
ncbi:MAG: hypothetical protein IKE81_04725, partial [Clostridia bacterium]|nr:hypothetical protein [Clostridia bacterium]